MIRDYVLTVGPFKGHTLVDASRLCHEEDRVYDMVTARKENLRMDLTGLSWMGWYLSHQAQWMTNSGREEVPDRDQIAAFLVAHYCELAQS